MSYSESNSYFNPEEEEDQTDSGNILSSEDETIQNKLNEKIIIFTQVPQYVYKAIDRNNREPSELSLKLCARLGVNSFTDFIERFKQEIEQRKQYEGFEKFSGPVCGIISSQLKQVLCLDTIEDFLAQDSSEVSHKFESILIQKQRSNLTSAIQIFGSLDPKLNLEHEFFIWMITQMCRITIDYDEVGCDKNYKCIALVTRLEKKSQKKKKEKAYWILLGNDNDLTICDSQGEKEGAPLPVDLFSFSRKNPEKSKKSKEESKAEIYEMNVHQLPSAIKTKFDIDFEKNPAFDRNLWEYDCLRVKKVPFYRSLGYFETKYHPSYIEAASRCILHPLALILRAIFSYDDSHNPILNPSQCNEVFKSFFDLYLSQERAFEMINVMVVEGLLDNIAVNEALNASGIKTSLFNMYGIEDAFIPNQANQSGLNLAQIQLSSSGVNLSQANISRVSSQANINNSQSQANINNSQSQANINNGQPQAQGYQNTPVAQNEFIQARNNDGKKSFLTFFTVWFLQRYSNNYFNRVICHIVTEIDLHPSLEDKNVEEAVNLIKYFVNTIIDNYDQISPQIHHFASVLQNFVVVKWDQKLYLYLILKEFFFDLYIYRMIKEPRFWDNKFTLPSQTKRSVEEIKETADLFIQMIDVFLSTDKHIEQKYPMFRDKMDILRPLQERMFQFIMRLPVITLDHCYNQDVSTLQQQNAISFILMTISELAKKKKIINPTEIQGLSKKTKQRYTNEFQEFIQKKKTRLVNTPIFYSVSYFIRCLVSDKDNYGLLDNTDRQVFKANYLIETSNYKENNYDEEEEEEEDINLEVPKVTAHFPSSLQSIDSSGAKKKTASKSTHIKDSGKIKKKGESSKSSIKGKTGKSGKSGRESEADSHHYESSSHRSRSSSRSTSKTKKVLSESDDYEPSNRSKKSIHSSNRKHSKGTDKESSDDSFEILPEGYSDDDENLKKTEKQLKRKRHEYSDDYEERLTSSRSRNKQKGSKNKRESTEDLDRESSPSKSGRTSRSTSRGNSRSSSRLSESRHSSSHRRHTSTVEPDSDD